MCFLFSSSCFLRPPPLAKERKESAEATSLSRKRGKRKEFPSYSIVSTEGGREECDFFDPWPFFRGWGTEGRSSHLSSPSEKRRGGEKIKSSFISSFFCRIGVRLISQLSNRDRSPGEEREKEMSASLSPP